MQEHENDTGLAVADITMASCLRKIVPDDVCEKLQKMSDKVLYSDVKKFIIDYVGLHTSHDAKHVEALLVQVLATEQVSGTRQVHKSEVGR